MAVRTWDQSKLNLEAAKQDKIVRGDIVRSYDFPGSRDDCYIEGVVMEHDGPRTGMVKIHVTREVWGGEEIQVARFEVHAPMGTSSMFEGAPAVFLIEKRKERS